MATVPLARYELLAYCRIQNRARSVKSGTVVPYAAYYGQGGIAIAKNMFQRAEAPFRSLLPQQTCEDRDLQYDFRESFF